MRTFAVCWFAFALLAVAIGCGGGDDTGHGPTIVPDDDAGTGSNTCIDEDGDGYGKYCRRGLDCDDADPSVTDECRRCIAPTKGCRCEAGTDPVSCDLPTMQVTGGILVCEDGTRYCRGGTWSDCESISGYVFRPTP